MQEEPGMAWSQRVRLPSLEGCRGWGRGTSLGVRTRSPRPWDEPTLTTWCWVLGTRNSSSCHGGRGFYRCLSLPFCPLWLLSRWFRPCSLKDWQSGPRTGGGSGRVWVSRADAQGAQGGCMWDKRKGVAARTGSQGFV